MRLQEELSVDIKILDYEEHALQSGSNSQAAAYIHLLDVESGKVTYGVVDILGYDRFQLTRFFPFGKL